MQDKNECKTCMFNNNCFLGHDLKRCNEIKNRKRVLLSWYGGKKPLLKYLLPFPKYDSYLELFGGSGTVLLNKIPSKIEIYNDIYTDLVNTFIQLRENCLLFFLLQLYLPASKPFFDNINETRVRNAILPSSITNLLNLKDNQRNNLLIDAISFFYKNRMSYSSNNRYFYGITIGKTRKKSRRNSIIEDFGFYFNIWNRIKDIQFFNENYKVFLVKKQDLVDRPGVLIYLDPPYQDGGKEYMSVCKDNEEWNNESFTELFEIINSFENARIVVSFDDLSYFDLLKGWNYQEIKRVNRFNVTKDKTCKVKTEYIFRNFDNKKVKKMISGKKNLALNDFITREGEFV
ncbi:MAG: DNA adenine methylase [Promethearchaeota archaeon]